MLRLHTSKSTMNKLIDNIRQVQENPRFVRFGAAKCGCRKNSPGSAFFCWLRLKYKHYLESKIDFNRFDQKLSLKLDRVEDAE